MGNNRGKIQFLLKLHLYAASLWGIVLQDGFFGTAVQQQWYVLSMTKQWHDMLFLSWPNKFVILIYDYLHTQTVLLIQQMFYLLARVTLLCLTSPFFLCFPSCQSYLKTHVVSHDLFIVKTDFDSAFIQSNCRLIFGRIAQTQANMF